MGERGSEYGVSRLPLVKHAQSMNTDRHCLLYPADDTIIVTYLAGERECHALMFIS